MKRIILDEKEFEKQDYSTTELVGDEFSCCTFSNCNFSSGSLSNKEFIDCVFDNCNLSNIRLKNTDLKNVRFINCKLIGIDFGSCSKFLFSVNFSKCQLNYSSFVNMDIKRTIFSECIIKEANFAESNLTEVAFLNCDLLRTIFEMTDLTRSNFSTAYNYSIDPTVNIVRKAKFSYPSVLGLLDKFNVEIT